MTKRLRLHSTLLAYIITMEAVMSKHSILSLFILLAVGLPGTITFAQNDAIADSTTRHVYIETTTGGTISGSVISEDESTVTVRDQAFGTIIVDRSTITKIEFRDQSHYREGQFWYANPAATRYLFGPTAWPLGNGEGYYQNTYLIMNTFFVGAGDNVVIGGGFEILSLSAGKPVFFFMPKVSIPLSEHAAAGVGVAMAGMPDEGLVGIGYGVLTLGNRDDNITFGLGYGWSDEEAMDQPIITISGMLRTSRSFALVTENWFVPEHGGTFYIISYGLRFMSESLSVDVAFLNNGDIAKGLPLGIPYVSLMVRF
jgi:hypothetical protein